MLLYLNLRISYSMFPFSSFSKSRRRSIKPRIPKTKGATLRVNDGHHLLVDLVPGQQHFGFFFWNNNSNCCGWLGGLLKRTWYDSFSDNKILRCRIIETRPFAGSCEACRSVCRGNPGAGFTIICTQANATANGLSL